MGSFGEAVIREGFVETRTERPYTITEQGKPGDRTPEGFADVDVIVSNMESSPDDAAWLADGRRSLSTDLEKMYGQSLREMRLAKGYSQARLGALIGSSQSHIARIESGHEDVQVSTLLRIAEALQIEPGQAFRGFLLRFVAS